MCLELNHSERLPLGVVKIVNDASFLLHGLIEHVWKLRLKAHHPKKAWS